MRRPPGNFHADVDAWVTATKQRLNAVFRESAQRVITEMQKPGPSVASTKASIKAGVGKIGGAQVSGPVRASGQGGNMPIDTGFLRASLQVVLNGEPAPASRPNPGGNHDYNATAAVLTIARATYRDTIYATYTANYAPHVEYGANGATPRRFVALAAAQWPRIVREVTAEAKSRVLGGR